MLSIASIANAQNDTLYMYKDGKATLISAVAGIDSMVVKKTKAKLTIGQSYQGGLVAAIYTSNDDTENKGLIVAPTDQSAGIPWSIGTNTLVGATSDFGAENTNTILSKLGKGNYAASICNDLVLNGYDDWFLPSYNELSYVCFYQSALNISGTTNKVYWCSNESQINSAQIYNFVYCTSYSSIKSALLNVRAMRYITPDTSTNRTNTIYFYRNGVVINFFETNNIDSLSFQKPQNQLYEGMFYQGGILAKIFQPSDSGYVAGETHGLIISSNYQSNGIAWDNGTHVNTNAYSSNGLINTGKIIAVQGVGNYAATICYDLVLNDYHDWYLPSEYELQLISDNMYKFSKDKINIWSSTDYGKGLYAYNSQRTAVLKEQLLPVRAVRRF